MYYIYFYIKQGSTRQDFQNPVRKGGSTRQDFQNPVRKGGSSREPWVPSLEPLGSFAASRRMEYK